MRDRLIELLRDTFNYTKDVCIDFDEAVKINADYLLANGVIVPPCNLEDEIWFIEKDNHHHSRISHGYVIRFDIRNMWGLGLTKNVAIQPVDTLEDRLYFVMFEWIGKDYFLTREEAEEALKGGEDK